MSKPPASQIPRLPRLRAGSSSWRLPLCDYATFELVRVLLIGDPAERDTLVAELMSVDPSLTLWAACAAGTWSGTVAGSSAGTVAAAVDAAAGNVTPGNPGPSGGGPRCVMDLAQWFARHALQLLHWSPAELAEPPAARDVPVRWRELAADAVAVATLAADAVADDAVAAEAFLFGLLHNAPEWLRSCGPRVSVTRQQPGCLPDWLVQLLRERARPARRATVQQVARATKLWRESGRRGRRVADIDVTEALLARRRWQTSGKVVDASRHLLVGLTDRLRRLGQLEHDFQRTLEHERLASLGELAYGASHEINNPLANISTRAQALLSEEPDPERRRMLAIINTQAFRANEMIADMMLFARPPELVRHDLDLVQLVSSVAAELAEEARLQGTQLRCTNRIDPLIVSADATQLAMAIRAVCVNALQALGAEGELELTVRPSGPAPDELHGWARIEIRDTGPGIPPRVRRHLFDPFFSGREAGRGLGLGLSKCWRVVTLHGGRIDVISQPRQGTTFVLHLPLGVPDALQAGQRSVV